MALTTEQWARAIGLTRAAEMMQGPGGPPNRRTVRRWADPEIGYRPLGWTGPPLVLRTVRYSREIITLPEWVEEFERERARMANWEAQPA